MEISLSYILKDRLVLFRASPNKFRNHLNDISIYVKTTMALDYINDITDLIERKLYDNQI